MANIRAHQQKVGFIRLRLRTRVKQATKLAETRTKNLVQTKAIEEDIRAQKIVALEEENKC
jgi:hypothetical protein